MKILLLFLLILPLGLSSQTYKDIYSNGIYFLSDEDNPQNNVKWVSPIIASSITFTLPPNFGQAGFAMASVGDGSLTWSDISLIVGTASGNNGEIQYNNNGSFGASSNLFWDRTNKRLGIKTSSPQYSLDVNGNVGVGVNGSGGGVALYSEQGATDYYYYFKAPSAMASSKTYTWPGNLAPANQIMTTDGNGNLQWNTSWAGTAGDCVGQGTDKGSAGNNTASGGDSFIGGGTGNTSTGTNGFIGGGLNNTSAGANSGIIAGEYNSIGTGATNSLIGGGEQNNIQSSYSVIYAGEYNKIDSDANNSFIASGRYNYINASYSAIGSGESNTINSNSNYSYIGAGKTNVISANSPYSSIHNGWNNTIASSSSYSVIGAGEYNDVNGSYSFVGAGYDNNITGSYSSIFAGRDNNLTGNYSTIGAGRENIVNGNHALVLGYQSTASANNTVVFGRKATSSHEGSFVFADGNNAAVSSSTTNQMTMRYTDEISFYTNSGSSVGARLNGGNSSWSTISDRSLKENILTLNPKLILEKLNKLNIFSWSYIGYGDKGIRNYGPMAQDFYELFGEDGIGQIGTDKTITFYDLSSVGILGVQALKENLINNKLKISELEYKNQVYKDKLQKLKEMKIKLEANLNSEVEK